MTEITLSVFHFIKDDEFLMIRNCFIDPCRQASSSHDEPGRANRHFRDITLGAAIQRHEAEFKRSVACSACARPHSASERQQNVGRRRLAVTGTSDKEEQQADRRKLAEKRARTSNREGRLPGGCHMRWRIRHHRAAPDPTRRRALPRIRGFLQRRA